MRNRLWLSGAAGMLAAGLLVHGGPRELTAREAEGLEGGMCLEGYKCVVIGDCTIWNIQNMLLCPNEAGCTVCSSSDHVWGCFAAVGQECDYRGSVSVKCGGVLAGVCDENDNCTQLVPIPGSFCSDGPKCASTCP